MNRVMCGLVTLALWFGCAAPATAGPINVLWYTGGVVSTAGGNFSSYTNMINALVATAASPPAGVPANTWTVTQWAGGAMPAGSFNVLVTASSEGPWATAPNYTPLISANPTLGSRVLVTGQDADLHLIKGAPLGTTYNGPLGFLVDAIDWAGSGTGLGAVFLSPANGVLTGLVGLGSRTTSLSNDTVTIPGAFAAFPINTNLTSAGLSNWGNSSHDFWTGTDSTKFTAINIDGSNRAVTLVSFQDAGGALTAVPEPATLVVFGGIALAGTFGYRRRKATTVA